VKRFERKSYDVDAMIMPTVPRIAPRIEALERNAETFRAANGNMLRNASLVNFLDACALTFPIHPPGTAPVGLMVVGFGGEDERILSAVSRSRRRWRIRDRFSWIRDEIYCRGIAAWTPSGGPC